jgi:hypothetical protein
MRRWPLAPLLLLVASACCGQLESRQEAAVQTWLECQDCEGSPLDSVVAIGRCAVPRLAEALHAGPPPARVATYRDYLFTLYAKVHTDTVPVGTAPSAPSAPARRAVAAVLGNYRLQYRSRAAYALGRIKGSAAVRALDSALADSSNTGSLRSDIRAARALAGGP